MCQNWNWKNSAARGRCFRFNLGGGIFLPPIKTFSSNLVYRQKMSPDVWKSFFKHPRWQAVAMFYQVNRYNSSASLVLTSLNTRLCAKPPENAHHGSPQTDAPCTNPHLLQKTSPQAKPFGQKCSIANAGHFPVQTNFVSLWASYRSLGTTSCLCHYVTPSHQVF